MTWDRFPTELSQFAKQLSRNRRTERTGIALMTLDGSLRNSWKAEHRMKTGSDGIPLPVPRSQGLHPTGTKLAEAFISFDFRADTKAAQHHADFQVRVTGELDLPNSLIRLEDHWRVDTDFTAVAAAREPHPPYHFQRGGHAQDVFAREQFYVPGPALPPDTEWCALLQCTGPRMMTPPMCPILAIDFTISQHDGTIWRQLRDVPEYCSCVENAQKRLWAPYFEALNDPKRRGSLIGPLLALKPHS